MTSSTIVSPSPAIFGFLDKLASLLVFPSLADTSLASASESKAVSLDTSCRSVSLLEALEFVPDLFERKTCWSEHHSNAGNRELLVVIPLSSLLWFR
jgi:hypothetical protein